MTRVYGMYLFRTNIRCDAVHKSPASRVTSSDYTLFTAIQEHDIELIFQLDNETAVES